MSKIINQLEKPVHSASSCISKAGKKKLRSEMHPPKVHSASSCISKAGKKKLRSEMHPPKVHSASSCISKTGRTKEKWRRQFRARIRDKREEKWAFKRASHDLSLMLSRLNIWKTGMIVAGYHALPDELSVESFYQKYQHKCDFVFPQIRPMEERMRFVPPLSNREEDWEKTSWGGFQPVGEEEVPVYEIDVFLIPALVFDRMGRRLGRGKGFYDRALTRSVGLKLGLAGSYQISEFALPEEDHDIKMDAVLTDQFLCVALKHSRMFNLTGSGVTVQ